LARTEERRRRVIKPPAQRRRDLLAAALRTFKKRGVADATVDEIVRRAGVAKGTFYLYFGSKEELIAALQEQSGREMLERVERVLARAGREEWRELAAALVGEMIAFYLERRDEFHLLAHGSDRSGREVMAHAEDKILETLTDFIVRGNNAGAFAVNEPETTAALLFHGIHGTMVQLIHHGNLTADRLKRAAIELTDRALGHPATGGR